MSIMIDIYRHELYHGPIAAIILVSKIAQEQKEENGLNIRN